MLPCAYKSFFGIDCPACGFQRSFILLLKGNFADSFVMYPPLLFVLLMLVAFTVHAFNKKLIGKRIVTSYAWTVLGIVILSYIIKMVFYNGEIIS